MNFWLIVIHRIITAVSGDITQLHNFVSIVVQLVTWICSLGSRHPLDKCFLHHNSTVSSHPNPEKLTSTKFSPWHNSSALVVCATIYCNQIARRWIFHQIWNVCEKSLVKWALWMDFHYSDIIMGQIASQITSLTIVYSTIYSDADQRIHQSSTSLAFVQGIHRQLVNSPHKWPVTRKMFPFDDVIMY